MNANTVVLLDTGILGLITHPRISAEADGCNQWIASLMAQGVEINVPEISDYELRRELLRLGKIKKHQAAGRAKNLAGICAAYYSNNAPGSSILGASASAGKANSG